MKKCLYCGAEYPDDAVMCASDHTALTNPAESALPSAVLGSGYDFAPTPAADSQKAFVTLVTCGALVDADLVVARLRAEGIEAFLPDESLMLTVGWNFNTYGYVRVQVSPKDYEAAKILLEAIEHDDAETV